MALLINQALDGMISIEQLKTITAKTEGLIILQQRIHDAEMAVARLQDEKKELEDEADQLRLLLRQPMQEIANKDRFFQATYEKQMEVMADWMVSQKAFKELAIQFGCKQGFTAEEIIQQGQKIKISVLENKHDPKHNTNAGDSTIIGPRIEKLKGKFFAKDS